MSHWKEKDAGAIGSSGPAAGAVPTVLVIDDYKRLDFGSLENTFEFVRVDGLDKSADGTDKLDVALNYLHRTGQVPLAALVDINIDAHKTGLNVVQRLRTSPATARTVPIVYSNTIGWGDQLVADGFSVGDLQVLLCAYAAGPGISVLGKEKDSALDELRAALHKLRLSWANPNVSAHRLLSTRVPGLTYIPAVRFDGGTGGSSDIVELLYGSDGKVLFWQSVMTMQTSDALKVAIETPHRRQTNTLDFGGDGIAPKGHVAQFINGKLGRLIHAWHANGETLLPPGALTTGWLDPGDDRPGTALHVLEKFVARYKVLLARPSVIEFAEQYFRQPRPD